METTHGDLVSKLQVIDVDLCHFVHVHVAAGRKQIIGIVSTTQEPSGSSLVHHVALLQGARHHDEGQHWNLGWFELNDVRTEGWKVLWRRGLKLARRTDFVCRVTGVDLVNGRGVIEQTNR